MNATTIIAPTTPREIFRACRRAGTTTYTINNPTTREFRRETTKAYFGVVEVPRGLGKLRDCMISAVWARNIFLATTPPTLTERLANYVEAKYSNLIRVRGGETAISEKDRDVPLRLIATDGHYRLLRCEGWRHYSRRFGARYATLCYLCGTDDNGLWAVRVPGTIMTIPEALAAITPAAVAKAIAKGKRVLRQGDVYAVETTKAHDNAGWYKIPANHEWNRETRELRHVDETSPHATLKIPFPVHFYVQTVLRMGRGWGRGRGD